MPNSLSPATLSPAPSLYRGRVRHRRFHPAVHEFEYPLFLAFLDIDRLPEQLDGSLWTGYERSRPLAYRERDHFGDPSLPLRQRVERDADRAGITLPDGPIYLLTHLRHFGYCFNPISLFYCYDKAGAVGPVLAEVNSTFGESHNYWLPGLQARGLDKRLYVSPFNGLDNTYDFHLSAPGPTLAVHIDTFRAGERFFDATLTLEREPWEPATVRRTLFELPLMTWQVITAIHWEALKLFSKRVPYVPHPGKVTAR